VNRKLVNSALGVALAAVAVTGYVSLHPSDASETRPVTAKVTKGTVLSTVSATGNTSPETSVGVDFAVGGTITEIAVAEGDRVEKGQVLAKVDGVDQQNAVRTAEADLASAKAKLADLEAGLTGDEKAKAAITLDQARQSVAEAQASLDDLKATNAQNAKDYVTAITKASEALEDTKAQVAQNGIGYDLKVTQASNSYNSVLAEKARDEDALDEAKDDLDDAQDDYDDDCDGGDDSACQKIESAEDAVDQAETALDLDDESIQSALLNVTSAQHDKSVGVLKDQQSVADAGQAVTDAKASQQAGLLKDDQSLRSAQRSLAKAELSLRSTEIDGRIDAEPADAADVAAAEASVATARSNLDQAEEDDADTTLVAPASGTVSSIANDVGETVSGGGGVSTSSSSSSASSSSSGSSSSNFVTLTDLDTMQVVAGFSEADAAKVQVGQPATVTFDALPGEEVAADVVAVDTESTVTSNVVTYDVTVLLHQSVDGLKSGMTASVEVVVDKADGVLEVPSAAVSSRGGSSTVTVLDADGERSTKAVSVGVEGDDATEITSGLQEGDEVVTSGGTSAVSTGTGTGGGFPGGGGGVRIGGGGFGR
jgi:multidrug efflux pump subunit AcrA (membrane-fusion protein)